MVIVHPGGGNFFSERLNNGSFKRSFQNQDCTTKMWTPGSFTNSYTMGHYFSAMQLADLP